ncbi:MAG TPA: methyltransferase domain-containing protein [Myxococcales bacterium]|nr:methyltransferase domain-containing protein [Myxococcales bacterium]
MLRSGLFFNAVAAPYERLTRTRVWEDHCAQMARELPPDARRVLDLGCGPGNSTAHLLRAVGAGAAGADVALPMLARARRREPSLSLLCADGARLPVRSSSLDAVTFHSVLYLLPERGAALREVARVLRPGGRAVLLEPHAGVRATVVGLARALPTPRWFLTALVWRVMSRAYGRFTAEDLRLRLAEVGLRVLKMEEALGGLGLLAVAERPTAAADVAGAAQGPAMARAMRPSQA